MTRIVEKLTERSRSRGRGSRLLHSIEAIGLVLRLRRHRNGGNRPRLMVVYDHPCQPAGEPNNYQISEVAIHP
jgi:hypothetical protein